MQTDQRRGKSLWSPFCIMRTFAGVLSAFLLMLTKLPLPKSQRKHVPPSAIPLELLGQNCFIEDPMKGLKETLVPNPFATIFCQLHHEEDRQ